MSWYNIFVNPGFAHIARYIYSLCEDSDGFSIPTYRWRDPEFLIKEGHISLIERALLRMTKLDKILDAKKVIPFYPFTTKHLELLIQHKHVSLFRQIAELLPHKLDSDLIYGAFKTGNEEIAICVKNMLQLYKAQMKGSKIYDNGQLVLNAIEGGNPQLVKIAFEMAGPSFKVGLTILKIAILTNNTDIMKEMVGRVREDIFFLEYIPLYEKAGSMTNNELLWYLQKISRYSEMNRQGQVECQLKYFKGSLKTSLFKERCPGLLNQNLFEYLLVAVDLGNVQAAQFISDIIKELPCSVILEQQNEVIQDLAYDDVDEVLTRHAFESKNPSMLEFIWNSVTDKNKFVGIFLLKSYGHIDQECLDWCFSKELLLHSIKGHEDGMAIFPPKTIKYLIKAGCKIKPNKILLAGILGGDLELCKYAKSIYGPIDPLFESTCRNGLLKGSYGKNPNTVKWLVDTLYELKRNDTLQQDDNLPRDYSLLHEAINGENNHAIDYILDTRPEEITEVKYFKEAINNGYYRVVDPKITPIDKFNSWNVLYDGSDFIPKTLIYNGDIFWIRRFLDIYQVDCKYLSRMATLAACSSQWLVLVYLVKRGAKIDGTILPLLVDRLVELAKHNLAIKLVDYIENITESQIASLLQDRHYFIINSIITKFSGCYNANAVISRLGYGTTQFPDHIYLREVIKNGVVVDINELYNLLTEKLACEQAGYILEGVTERKIQIIRKEAVEPQFIKTYKREKLERAITEALLNVKMKEEDTKESKIHSESSDEDEIVFVPKKRKS